MGKDINENYEVTIDGRVFSKGFFRVNHKSGSGYMTKPRQLKHGVSKTGHCYVSLGRNNHHLIHRLVYKAFVGDIPKGFEIHHIDGNPENNRIDNLSLVTRQHHVLIHQLQEKGYVGAVYHHKQKGGYYAKIGDKYIGYRKTKEDCMNLLLSSQ